MDDDSVGRKEDDNQETNEDSSYSWLLRLRGVDCVKNQMESERGCPTSRKGQAPVKASCRAAPGKIEQNVTVFKYGCFVFPFHDMGIAMQLHKGCCVLAEKPADGIPPKEITQETQQHTLQSMVTFHMNEFMLQY